MNILHINMSMDTVRGGGTVERVLKLHKALKNMPDICSHILSIDVGEKSNTGLPKDEITQLPCWNKRWYLPVPKSKVVKELLMWSDVVHITNHWTIINAWIYLLVRAMKKPYVVCPAGSLTIFGRSQLFKKIYHFIIGHRVIENASAGIVVSEDETKDLVQSGLEPASIYHISNGVNESEYKFDDSALFREVININVDEPYLLFVGRLNEIKGPDILLDAFSKLKNDIDHHLVFVGPDEGLKALLEKTVSNNNLEKRVHFVEFISGNLKSSAYHGAELLIVPSRHEAMSIVALEAAITGTPVLLSNQCGFSALVDAGGAMEVEPTIGGIKNGLKNMLMPTGKLNNIGEAGRLFVQTKYTWEKVAEQYVNVFSKLLENNTFLPDRERLEKKSHASENIFGKIIFPFALSLNMFSMTVLLIVLGFFKEAEVAADVGIVQAATLLVFMAFSSNARNIILSKNKSITLEHFLKFRIMLIVPLSLVAYSLSERFVELEIAIVFCLILRRSLEWIAELQISERELVNDKKYACIYSGIQIGTLLALLATVYSGLDGYFSITLVLWSSSPAWIILPFVNKTFPNNNNLNISWLLLLPHLGSSWIIASSTYIFRVLIILVAGKAIGGLLFSAYAIGGMINSIYTYALGPSIASKLKDKGSIKERKLTALIVCLLFLLGTFITIFSVYSNQLELNNIHYSLAVGLSLIGSGIMLVAQRRRIHILQKDKNSVFVPDIIANLSIIMSVPIAYYVIGVNSLPGLFLWNSMLTYIIYRMASMRYKYDL
jgi:glycosyltransferase involved in cell wall biosynthesis